MVQALTPAHQLFLQRMMAAKVMTDDDAKKLHKEIVLLYDDSNDHSQDFERFVGRISSNLRENLDFDIRTAILFDEAVSSSSSSLTTRYHAFVNRVGDAPAQLYGAFNKNPHEIALFKIVLEKLIQKGNGDEENDDCSENEDNNAPRRVSKTVTGCRGYMSFMEMLALRSELTEPHEGKLTLQQAQDALEKFIQEKWLVPRRNNKNDDRRTSTSSSASSGKRRRASAAADDEDLTNVPNGTKNIHGIGFCIKSHGPCKHA